MKKRADAVIGAPGQLVNEGCGGSATCKRARPTGSEGGT